MTGRLVLVRHGQSHGNVDAAARHPPARRRADRPRPSSRRGPSAGDWHAPDRDGGALRRAACDRRPPPRSATHLGLEPHRARRHPRGAGRRPRGPQRRRRRSRSSTPSTSGGTSGDLDVPLPGGESGQQVLDRYLPVVTQLRLRYLDDHAWHGRRRRGQPRRRDPAGRRGAGGRRRRLRPRTSPRQHRMRGAEPDHRRPVELRAVGRAGAAVLSRARAAPGRGRARTPPIRWADVDREPRAQAQPTASQSMLKACTTSGVAQSSSVHSDRRTRVVDDGAVAVVAARLGTRRQSSAMARS